MHLVFQLAAGLQHDHRLMHSGAWFQDRLRSSPKYCFHTVSDSSQNCSGRSCKRGCSNRTSNQHSRGAGSDAPPRLIVVHSVHRDSIWLTRKPVPIEPDAKWFVVFRLSRVSVRGKPGSVPCGRRRGWYRARDRPGGKHQRNCVPRQKCRGIFGIWKRLKSEDAFGAFRTFEGKFLLGRK